MVKNAEIKCPGCDKPSSLGVINDDGSTGEITHTCANKGCGQVTIIGRKGQAVAVLQFEDIKLTDIEGPKKP
jgi:hypothetical protein